MDACGHVNHAKTITSLEEARVQVLFVKDYSGEWALLSEWQAATEQELDSA